MEKLKLKTNKRPFVMLYYDFIKCNLLNWNEKDIYIILLMYAEKDSKQCFPSISKLCKISGKSKNTVLKAINGLEDKKILKKEKRVTKKGQTSNLYTLYDIDTIWRSENVEELKVKIDKDEEKHMIEALMAKGYYVTKEKEPEALRANQSNNDSSTQLNNFYQSDTTTNFEQSQDLERYTLDQIKQLFEYDNMLIDHADRQHDIDTIMGVLHTAMNTGKSTIRIFGEDKPAMVVIAKLMKLDKESIMYAIDKFSEQSKRIKNPTAYLLTILYNAPEQYYLDKKNQEKNEMSKENCSQEEKRTNIENLDSKNSFSNFMQRTYDYDSLEKELLNRQNNS